MISLILDLRFSFYTCVLNLHKARHRYSLTQASTEFASKTTNWKYVCAPKTNLKFLPHCCPPFASSSTWPGATASQGFWGGEVAMTSNIFRPQLKRNHQVGLSNQIFIKKLEIRCKMDFWLYEESAEWKGHPKQLERSGQAVKASKLWSRPIISRRWNFSQMDWLWRNNFIFLDPFFRHRSTMKTLDLFSQPIFLVEMIWYL